MTKDELYDKAIERIQDTDFPCSLSAYGGGACGDDWTDGDTLSLSRAEILYLLFGPDGYGDEKGEEIDVESALESMARNGAFPDGRVYHENEDDDDYYDDPDSYDCRGESEELNYFINSFETLLEKIDDGEITEDNFEDWMEYFDDPDYWTEDIEEWKKFYDDFDED